MDVITNTVLIFCIAILILELLFYAFRTIRNPDRARIKKELRKMASKKQGEELPDILRKKVISEVPALNEILLRISGIEYLDRLRCQASVRYSTGFFVLLSLFFAALGFTGLYVLAKKRNMVICNPCFIDWQSPCLLSLHKETSEIEKVSDSIARGSRPDGSIPESGSCLFNRHESGVG